MKIGRLLLLLPGPVFFIKTEEPGFSFFYPNGLERTDQFGRVRALSRAEQSQDEDPGSAGRVVHPQVLDGFPDSKLGSGSQPESSQIVAFHQMRDVTQRQLLFDKLQK